MLSLREAQTDSNGEKKRVQRDSSIIWSGNQLPKYLWDHWKEELRPMGLNWQSFMRILRHRTDIGVMWYQDTITWSEFIARLIKLLEGPIGQASVQPLHKEASPLDLGMWQIPPLQDWEKFERLCLDLWKEIWHDAKAQRVGTSGQSQNGVDIIGTHPVSQKTVGVQCKKKDTIYASKTLTVDELREIVEEAKTFIPPLSEFTIAYIGKRDQILQQEARIITDRHRIEGFFSVHVSSWDDIMEVLGTYSHVFFKHYSAYQGLSGLNVDQKELERRLEVSQGLEDLDDEILAGRDISISTKEVIKEIVKSTSDTSIVVSEHDAEIDYARDLLDKIKPKEALNFLEKLESRIWSGADSVRKFRILTNKAVALSLLGKSEEAGRLFIEAYQYNQDDEKAICNRAIGHLLLDQLDDATVFVTEALKKNPSSIRAHGILISCSSVGESFDEIVKKVPKNLRKKGDVAYALAQEARKRGDGKNAEYWLRVSYEDRKKNDEKEDPDLMGNIATAILESFAKRYEVVSNIQLSPEDKSRLEDAIDLLTNAIVLTPVDTLAYRSHWYVNRSTAYKLIGKYDSALADTKRAYELNPNDDLIKKQYAFILNENGQRERALQIMQELQQESEIPEATLLYAGALCEAGEIEKAKQLLEVAPIEEFEANLKSEMQRLLIQIYTRLSEFENARKISADMRHAEPEDILNLLDAARIEEREGHIDSAASLLDEAKGYVDNETPSRSIIELADMLFSLEKYSDAWPLYERIVDPRVKSDLIKNLLYSCYRSGEYEKALNFCKYIPVENKNSFLMQIELAVLESKADLKQAIEAAENYLQHYPDDLNIHIHLATMWFRKEELTQLDVFLDQEFDVSKLSVDSGFQLVSLFAERSKDEKALQLAYEVRRKFFNVGEAHLKYVGAFLTREHEANHLLAEPDKIDAGSVVCVVNDLGQDTYYLLEDREDISEQLNEISIKMDPFAKKLIGKKVGDSVVTATGEVDSVSVKVTIIKNKYVHALHESMRLLPERFGEVKGIERITFKSGSEEETRESIKKMLGVVERRSELIMQAEKFYRESKLGAWSFASLIGRDIVEVWNGLVGSEWGIKCCNGSLEERQIALDTIEKSRIVAVDLTAIMTADRLGILPVLKKYFEKILVAQSTIDLLLESISRQRGQTSEGYSTISKEGERFIQRDVTSEEVKTQIKYLERLLQWVRENCESTAFAIPIDPNQETDRRKILGASSFDTIQIAKEQSCPLYTDDFGAKEVARNDFKVDGFWTQAFLIAAGVAKHIGEDEYYNATIELVKLKYRHITINGFALLRAAQRSNWAYTGDFKELMDSLRGTQMELSSTIRVVVEFIALLWRQPILEYQRDTLVMAILNTLSYQRDERQVLRLMRAAIVSRFRLTPLTEGRLQQIISAWQALRIRPGIE